MSDQERKNEITQSFMNVELVPNEIRPDLALNNAKTISYDDLMILGGASASTITTFVSSIVNMKSFKDLNLFRPLDVNGNPLKEPLLKFHKRPALMGVYINPEGGLNNAGWEKVNLVNSKSVAMPIIAIAVAVVLKGIAEKLNKIQETQQEILNFLQEDKRAALKANIDFLMDILSNYKHNWDNEMYKTNMHIKVLDIRQSAEQNIEFYRLRISDHLDKKKKFISDRNTKDRLSKVQTDLEDYRTALNLYAFSAYVEVLLLENYSSEYLDGISAKIRNLSMQYRELYSECYAKIKKYLKSSIDSKAIKGVAAASKVTGKVIEKIPLVSRGQLDENLIEAHSKLNKWNDDRPENTLKRLTSCKDISSNSFADQIDSISRLYNQPTVLYFDEKMIYLMPA